MPCESLFRLVNGVVEARFAAIAFIRGDGLWYACLNGVDAFGGVAEGSFMAGPTAISGCGVAYAC
ncbi:hypothetical protein ABTW95_25250 [Spirillospora sp. NPDC127506]